MMETIVLKWGTLKGWSALQPATVERLQQYADIGMNISAMAQRDTDEQKQILADVCDMVLDGGGEVYSDWSGEHFTRETARDYIMNYGSDSTAS